MSNAIRHTHESRDNLQEKVAPTNK